MNTGGLPLAISCFDTAMPSNKGEAIGILAGTTWAQFVERLSRRREGQKDGPCFAAATFETKPDGLHVGRKKNGALSRSAIVLDIEASKSTGEIPPPPDRALARAAALGLAAVLYTSHNHCADAPRYRVVLPMSDEISVDIPSPEIMAVELNLAGVIDRGKLGPAALFYFPSCPHGEAAQHYFKSIDGQPVDADCITDAGTALLRARQAEQSRIAVEAQAAAAERRAEKLSAGFDPDDSLIEKIRTRLDLQSILQSHGYEQRGQNFRHPNSSSGMYGANIKNLGGVDRIYSHNATDPLHESNLPEWCGTVTALDAFDVLAILEFSGDRKGALKKLAERFGLAKTAEKKELSALLFRLIRQQASQEEIERAAFANGVRLGLSHDDICRAAIWVLQQSVENRSAA